MSNYLKLKTFSPFSYQFMYLDTADHLADNIFIKNELPVKFCGDFVKENENYSIIVCKIKKNDFEKFDKSMEELEKKMLLMGNVDYVEKCNEFKTLIMTNKKDYEE